MQCDHGVALVSADVVIRCIYLSAGHNYFGHYGQPAGTHPTVSVASVHCRAGLGLEGDRFYGYRSSYKGQVTFFSWETFEAAKRRFCRPGLSPEAFRRNVLVDRLDLASLIGRKFSLGAVEFEGTEEARPCEWMDQAVAPGAWQWLRGQGGLRAKILSDGDLAVGSVSLRVLEEVA
jgi:MOSC domain-containing protein YiiM